MAKEVFSLYLRFFKKKFKISIEIYLQKNEYAISVHEVPLLILGVENGLCLFIFHHICLDKTFNVNGKNYFLWQ